MDKNNNNLSALLITYNEIDNIDDVIATVSFASEIIIVDSYSTDGTVEAIHKYKNVKLLQHKFVNFSSQRNFALQQATNDWVLFMDADERITEASKKEIVKVIQQPINIVAFAFKRVFYFKNKPLKYSGYQNSKVFRLFNKKKARYNEEKFVHETLDVSGQTKTLTHKLLHYSYTNDVDYKGKLLKYAQLRAKKLFKNKLKPNFYHFYIKPAYRFLSHYIVRLGFLDGSNGYKISKLNAFEVKQRYIELKKMYESNE